MLCLRRVALRTAVSASRAVSTRARITPFAAIAATRTNGVKLVAAHAVRFYSEAERSPASNDQPADAQRLADSEAEQQTADQAAQDLEESLTRTEADIQEAVQEVAHAAGQEAIESSEQEVTEAIAQGVAETPGQEGSEAAAPETQHVREQAHGCFVRNLVFELTEQHLKAAFEKYGPIADTYIVRDPRGLSKGYGFVNFQTREAQEQACQNVNGSFWHGRRITCVPRQTGQVKERKARSTTSTPTAQLYIGNIPYETTDAELNRLFRHLGNMDDVRVAVDRTTGWPRGFAHADFLSVEAATEAFKKLDGAVIGDRKLRIDYATGYQRKGARENSAHTRSVLDRS